MRDDGFNVEAALYHARHLVPGFEHLTPVNALDLELADEALLVRELADAADPGDVGRKKIQTTAAQLVSAVRKNAKTDGGIEAFLQQYYLSSSEGVLLMCVAEALLRIPDADTADRLIADKITSAEWKDHLGFSDSLFVNALTWGLLRRSMPRNWQCMATEHTRSRSIK